jgi:hypothetical protein
VGELGGCTNCKGKSGCDHRKDSMMAAVDRALADLYPTRTWGECADAGVQPCGGLSSEELAGLAEELAAELDAATFVRPGGDDEACDFIYVLCMGRVPCIVQVRDQGVDAPDEWHTLEDGGLGISELYLRLVISHRARMAAVQQIAIDLVRAHDGGFLVSERPRAGVYDAPLLARMQKLVAILPAYELLHVDFGEIAHAPPGYDPGVWRELYAGAPSIANYLFYAQPATMPSVTHLPGEVVS